MVRDYADERKLDFRTARLRRSASSASQKAYAERGIFP